MLDLIVAPETAVAHLQVAWDCRSGSHCLMSATGDGNSNVTLHRGIRDASLSPDYHERLERHIFIYGFRIEKEIVLARIAVRPPALARSEGEPPTIREESHRMSGNAQGMESRETGSAPSIVTRALSIAGVG